LDESPEHPRVTRLAESVARALRLTAGSDGGSEDADRPPRSVDTIEASVAD